MKISKKSWHYRLIKWVYYPKVWCKPNGDIPDMNSCEYFWLLFAAIVFVIPLLTLISPFILGEMLLKYLFCHKLEWKND